VLLDPGEIHTGEVIAEEGWHYRNLYPEPGLLERLVTEEAGRSGKGRSLPHFPEPVVRDAELAAAMDRLHRSLDSPKSALERQSRLLLVYTRLLARHAKSPPRWRPMGREPRAVSQAREYLEARYVHNVSLDELSSVVNLSKFHLLRVFQEAVGLPPHAYLNQVRVGRVKEMLSKGVPIAVAAHETGFVDQSHLTKRFKGVLGITPGQYVRESVRR
jgi:AraC-like DNA-binding protein